MPLRILHVSDIHFHRDVWDEDGDQRRELIDDVRGRVLEGGPVDAILVGGDIAFSGQPHEYDIARQWLQDLVAVCGGIDESRVFTVPGNHDVDVTVVQRSTVAQDLRVVLSTCEVSSINTELHRRLAEDPAATGLFLPLGGYNEFAQRYVCETTPEHPHWEDRTTFDVDGWPVCLTGQNSVLVSDLKDARFEDEDGRHRLVLGSHQCRLTREGQPIHIVMAHHPPSWIRDWDIVHPLMRRGHVWLHGHEHAYRAEQTIPMGSVQLSAGAVGPERDDAGEREPWVPAYSVVTLARTDDETLSVAVEPRFWSLQQTRFVAHPVGIEIFEVARDPSVSPSGDQALRVHESTAVTPLSDEPSGPGVDDTEPDSTARTAGQASPLADPHTDHPELAAPSASSVSRPDLRRYATQFMSLPLSDRIAIGQRLAVVGESDLAVGDAPDAYRLILRRINEQGLVPALIVELENRHAR